jgi:tetratricopeptide (TPR) repeat protein
MKLRLLSLALATALGLGLTTYSPDASAQRGKEDKAEVIEVLKTSGRKNPKASTSRDGARNLQKAIDLYYEDDEAKSAEALELVNRQLDSNSRLTPYEKAKFNQLKAQLLNDSDDLEGAIEAAQAALSPDGLPNIEYLDSQYNLAVMLSNAERYEESIATANAWAGDAPKMTSGVAVLQARNHYDLEQYDKAVEWIDQAFATGDEPQKAWFQIRVNALYSLERYDDAIAYLTELLSKQPGQPEFLNLLVNAYIEKENYPGALQVLLDAQTAGQLSNETQYVQIYQLYTSTDQPIKAAEALETFLGGGQIKPTANRYIDLGEAWYEAEKQDQALAAFRKASELSPDNGSADAWMGALLLDMEKAKDAKVALDTAFRKGSIKHEGNAYYNLALVQMELGDDAGARTNAQKALEYPQTKAAAESLLKNLNR